MSVVHNDILTIADGDNETAIKFFYTELEESEIATSLFNGCLANISTWRLEHFMYQHRIFCEVKNRKHIDKKNSKRTGRKDAIEVITFASEYDVAVDQTGKKVTLEFTFRTVQEMIIASLLLPKGLRKQYVDSRHYKRLADNSWCEIERPQFEIKQIEKPE